MKVTIAQASMSEKGKTWGVKGNQNGKELNMKELTNNTFTYCLRCVNPIIASAMGVVAVACVRNKHIGYSQPNRMGLWKQLQRLGDNVAIRNVLVDCDCDCSSYATVVAELGYYSYFRRWLPNLDMSVNAPTTSNLKTKLKNTGIFVCYNKPKLEDLKVGDILVTPNKHAVIVTDVSI